VAVDDDDKPISKIDPKTDINAKTFAALFCCSESFTYWLLNSGTVKGYRLGRRRGWRIPKESVDAYYDRLRNGPDGADD
jgi:excisionase family DNA binding protein